MINIFALILTTIITAAVSLFGGILLLGGSKLTKYFQQFGPAIAAVILLYATFGDIIPEILEEEALPVWQVALFVFLGILLCAGFGAILHHFHRHGNHPHPKNQRQAMAMLVVDSIHNLADGIVLGIAFASGIGTGITTALATVAHEIPQEIGDFSIMQRAKIPRRQIFKLQFISALVLVPSSLIAYFIGDILSQALPVVLSFVAGFLIYIALGECNSILIQLRAKMPKVKQIK